VLGIAEIGSYRISGARSRTQRERVAHYLRALDAYSH
jgi:hypothetical protein